MKNNNKVLRDTVISRVVLMLFAFCLLGVLTILYIMPFKKHSLEINNYYVYFEYAVMVITFLLAALCVFIGIRNRSRDYSSKIITPFMLILLSVPAFVFSVMIPATHNRTLCSQFAIICYLCLFIIYIVYHFLGNALTYQAVICSVYAVLMALMARLYNDNVTFTDKPVFEYATFALIFAGVVILAILVTYFVSKKHNGISLTHTAVLSLIIAAAIIVRMFIIRYVAAAAIATLVIAFIVICVREKKSSHTVR